MRALSIAALMLAGCAQGYGPASPHRLGEGEWQAVDINGTPVIDGSMVTLRLENGRVAGNSTCNSYSGPYQILSEQRIRFGALVATRAACAADALNEQERRFSEILTLAEGYSFYPDGSLSLIAGDGRAIRFRRN